MKRVPALPALQQYGVICHLSGDALGFARVGSSTARTVIQYYRTVVCDHYMLLLKLL